MIALAGLALGGSIASHAQVGSETDSDVTKELEDAQELKEKAEKEALKQAEQQRKKEEASKPKPPKEVFKPTEEISEDSPVPFPIDI